MQASSSQHRGNDVAFPEHEPSTSSQVSRPPLPSRSYQYAQQPPYGYAPYAGAQQAMMMRPEPPKRDWRDFFVSHLKAAY